MPNRRGRPLGRLHWEILEALDVRGSMTAKEAASVTRERRHSVSTALNRAVFKGFVSVEPGRVPVYSIVPGWRERIESGDYPLLPHGPVSKERPEKLRAPSARSVFEIGGMNA